MGGVQDAAGARLAASVREHRRAAGLTQRQLAQRSGLSVAAVRDLEQSRSRRPRRRSLDALVRSLGLDAGQSAALDAAWTRPVRHLGGCLRVMAAGCGWRCWGP
jgi:transcriptional regulator with XRE-family HTH domain